MGGPARSHRVFISHSRRDHAVAMEICHAIERRGVRCIIAPRDVPPGTHYPTWIGREVRNASAFVLVVSSTSQRSKACLSETEMAYNNDACPIYPICVEAIQKEDLLDGLAFLIGQNQMVDAVGAGRSKAIDRLSKTIARELVGTGGQKRPASLTDPIGKDGPFFRSLWTKMDRDGTAIAWLPEGAAFGPFWPYWRGMGLMGHGVLFTLAAATLVAGIVGGLRDAATVLLLGWVAFAALFAFFGAALLRRHVETSSAGSLKGAGPLPTMLGMAALAAALAIPQFAAPQQATQTATPATTNSVATDASAPAPAEVSAPAGAENVPTGNARKPGDGKDWRAENAQRQREVEAFIVGAQIGSEIERQRRNSTEEIHAGDNAEAAAEEVAE